MVTERYGFNVLCVCVFKTKPICHQNPIYSNSNKQCMRRCICLLVYFKCVGIVSVNPKLFGRWKCFFFQDFMEFFLEHTHTQLLCKQTQKTVTRRGKMYLCERVQLKIHFESNIFIFFGFSGWNNNNTNNAMTISSILLRADEPQT